MAISDVAKEVVNLKLFLKKTLGTQDVVVIFNDNQGAGDLTRNPVFHNSTKLWIFVTTSLESWLKTMK